MPQAMRYFVSAVSEDLPPERMRDQLISVGLDEQELDRAQQLLQDDPRLIEHASLAILESGWEDASEREVVDGALGAASTKLPVVEAALIAIVAVYGLRLAATRGRKMQRRVIRYRSDGSWDEEHTTEW